MNGLQIYEVSKRAYFKAQRQAELDRMWYEYTLDTPRLSIGERLRDLLLPMLVALRPANGRQARRQTSLG